jgi:hypothetical protein
MLTIILALWFTVMGIWPFHQPHVHEPINSGIVFVDVVVHLIGLYFLVTSLIGLAKTRR